jgi:hypothetical protein
MSTTKKLEWSPIEGQAGFFSKAAQAPNMTNPVIRRAVEELNREFKAIDEDVDLRSRDKFSLYESSRKP